MNVIDLDARRKAKKDAKKRHPAARWVRLGIKPGALTSKFCAECVSAYASWLLDGGMLADPDLYDWMRTAEVGAS